MTGLVLLVLLAACGNEAATTPPLTSGINTGTTNAATTQAITIGTPTGSAPLPANTTAPTTIAATASVGNPIIATITAGSGPANTASVKTATTQGVTSTTVATNLGAIGLPIYSGLKPVNLGTYASQIATGFSQASPTAKSSFYYTSESLDKISSFYNTEMTKLGFTKAIEQPLPASGDLPGNVLFYSKGTGPTTEVAGIFSLGPLDANLVKTLAEGAPGAADLKPNDTLVILISGLNGAYLTQLEQSFRGAGSPSPAASPAAPSPAAPSPAPTK